METIPTLLAARLAAALQSLGLTAEPQVLAANDRRFGDYQSNAAMILAKAQRVNPRELAQQVVDRLDVADCCVSTEIAGAGFINFRLRPDWLGQRCAECAADPRLGAPAASPAKQWVVDFSSPNVAKPMHVGHIRSTILGDALARIAAYLGHAVIRDNHIGDWGTQFGMLLTGWKTELNRAALEAAPLEEMERLYKLISARCKTDPSTLERARQELVKLQAGDAENLAIWKEMLRLSETQFETIYARLGVVFSVALGESFYNPRLKDIVADLQASGIAVESEGALCVFSDHSEKPENDPFLIKDQDGWRDNPALVQKSDGASNYTTTDLATLLHRFETWAPDEIVYVTDGRQQLHFRQLFAIFRRWRPELAAKARLSHVWFGSILGEDGKPFKTRSGETVRLAELLDEAEERAFQLVTSKSPDLEEPERREIARIVGLGAVKYADMLPNRQSDYVFSWDKMLSLQGNTAPYLQYSYARIRSIFRKASGEGVAPLLEDFPAPAEPLLLQEPAELALAKTLLRFGEVLPQVLEDYRPNLLANFLYDLASAFHAFFENCPVLKSEGAVRASRLALCALTAKVLQQGLTLMGIECPSRM